MFWDGQEIGRVISRRKEGAKSPKGMVTHKVWRAWRFGQDEFAAKEHASMEQALESII